MELHEIGSHFGLPQRTLKYVIEQGIVPGLQRNNPGRGNRRKLSRHQSALIALTALLHVGGLRGKLLTAAVKHGQVAISRRQSSFSVSLPDHGTPSLAVSVVVNIEGFTDVFQ